MKERLSHFHIHFTDLNLVSLSHFLMSIKLCVCAYSTGKGSGRCLYLHALEWGVYLFHNMMQISTSQNAHSSTNQPTHLPTHTHTHRISVKKGGLAIAQPDTNHDPLLQRQPQHILNINTCSRIHITSHIWYEEEAPTSSLDTNSINGKGSLIIPQHDANQDSFFSFHLQQIPKGDWS